MKHWLAVSGLAGALSLAVVAACGSSSNSALVPGDSNGSSGSPSSGPGSAGNGGGAQVVEDAAAALPPETKAESNYQSPIATGRVVWTANPTSGRVAFIDARTFAVQTVQAGAGPTYLAAVPDPSGQREQAIVLNVQSHDATFFRLDDAGAAPQATQYPTTNDANAWAVSPSGRWAIAWTDASRLSNPDPTQGFQTIAVLDLTAGQSTPLAVGYRPSQVVFSHDASATGSETRAFAVTQDGISVIDLRGAAPALVQNFSLAAAATPDASAEIDAAADAGPTDASADASAGDGGGATDSAVIPDVTGNDAPAVPGASPPVPSSTPDVSFVPDGTYALVRLDGAQTIQLLSLLDGTSTEVTFPVAPTDLTVAPDGTFAVAVLRDSATVAILPLPGITADPTAYSTIPIPGETIGRAIVAEDPAGTLTRVLLFTTAAPVDRMTVLSLGANPSYRQVTLHAPVLAVFPTDDAQNAVVLHQIGGSTSSTVQGAFSLVPISQALPAVIVSLPAPATAVALTTDRALVTLSNDQTATYGVDLAMMPSFNVLSYTLPSPPVAAGIAAASSTGFVAQNYTDGRITFIDLDAGGARTITGFELGARVVQ